MAGTVAPLNSILCYVGTWDKGSSSGTLNLASYLINHDPVTDHLISGAETRAWNSQCTLRLDASDGFLIGTFLHGNDWLDGNFWLRQQWNGTWYNLMYGNVPPDGWRNDYKNEILELTLNSVINTAAQHMIGYGNTTVVPVEPFQPHLRYMGTISDITDGTYTFEAYSPTRASFLKDWIPNAYIWEDLGTQINTDVQAKLRVDRQIQEWTLGGTTGTMGTFTSKVTFRSEPDWLIDGVGAYMTMPFPTDSYSSFVADPGNTEGIGTIWDFVADRLGLTWNAASRETFGSALQFCQIAYVEPAIKSDSLGTAPHYFGGERWYDVMTHLMASVGANWSVNPSGEITAFIRSPNDYPVTGTLDFRDAYNKEWVQTQTVGARNITVLSDWDDREAEYVGTSVASSTIVSGGDVQVPARWLRGIAGPTLAERMMLYNSQFQKRLSLDIEGSRWNEFTPGQAINITNLPYAVNPGCGGGVCIFTRFLVASRLYNRDDDITTIEVDYDGERTGWFVLNTSELNSDDKLW